MDQRSSPFYINSKAPQDHNANDKYDILADIGLSTKSKFYFISLNFFKHTTCTIQAVLYNIIYIKCIILNKI